MKILSTTLTPILACSLLFTACDQEPIEHQTQSEPARRLEKQRSEPKERQRYRLQVGDTITMQVYGEPDLNGEPTIEKTGKATFPLIGAVDARGLTISELEGIVDDHYRATYLLDPKIKISLND